MSDSMITRCPKCSTSFRVTQEVLSMAKGKVRCGQCFHIFTAQPMPPKANTHSTPNSAKSEPSSAVPEDVTRREPTYQYAAPDETPATSQNTPVQEDGNVNPDWLDTLFHEEDLAAYTPPAEHATAKTASEPKPPSHNSATADTLNAHAASPSNDTSPPQSRLDNLAPWEMELAELDEELSQQSPKHDPIFSEQLITQRSNVESTPTVTRSQVSPAREASEPDYMQALHSLAQDISKQDHLSSDEYHSQESMKQLAAEYSLASLTDTSAPKKRNKATKASWLWSLGSVLALIVFVVQIAIGFFESGSRSPELRGFYRAACSYLSCTLPAFEDISAIDIEHVRIQSHPTLPNTLQVNAIMTNTSQYTQPMPKLALEFYDLNRGPVAARLFAPRNYLHRDFLDITTMPPSTPIHVVIPIQDPGARAVTHQIKVFSNQTQSY